MQDQGKDMAHPNANENIILPKIDIVQNIHPSPSTEDGDSTSSARTQGERVII